MMRVVISDLFIGECELTGKSETECVRVQFDDSSPEAVVATTELFRLLRFQRKQKEKQDKAKSDEPQVQKGTLKC
jgi:hypothetical protein